MLINIGRTVVPKYGAKRNTLTLLFQTSCNFDVTITNAILKPEDPTRIGEIASGYEKIKNKRHCNNFSRSSSLFCVKYIYREPNAELVRTVVSHRHKSTLRNHVSCGLRGRISKAEYMMMIWIYR